VVPGQDVAGERSALRLAVVVLVVVVVVEDSMFLDSVGSEAAFALSLLARDREARQAWAMGQEVWSIGMRVEGKLQSRKEL